MPRSMQHPEYMDLDDFEELLINKPRDEKWELINGRVVRGMVGARLAHHDIVQNVNFALRTHICAKGLLCRTFTKRSGSSSGFCNSLRFRISWCGAGPWTAMLSRSTTR